MLGVMERKIMMDNIRDIFGSKSKSMWLAIAVLVFTCGCNGSKRIVETGVTRVDSSLANHSRLFEQQVIEVTEGVYVAVGFGLANSILLVGEDGAVVVDTLENMDEAEAVRTEFEKLTDKPVKTLIYTHNHTDHIFGARAWADSNPRVIAHASTNYYIDRIVTKLRPIIGTRSMRMFGTYLDDRGLVNAGIGPFLGFDENSCLGLIRPTEVFEQELEIEFAGLKIRLIHAPGETNDQIIVWLPDRGVLLCADNFYHSFPNLYTIRGTPYRDPEQWVAAIDMMRALKPKYLVPSHGRPLKGQSEIAAVLTDYRDAIQYVHDRTIRGINAGMTADQLAETIKLPEHLANKPYLQPFYGKVAWAVRSVFDGNLGWFDGNPSRLQPQSELERARMLAEIAGGEEALYQRAAEYLQQGRAQAALELTDALLALQPGAGRVEEVRVQALIVLAENEQNANARHWYLTEAMEIRDDFVALERTVPSREMVREFPLDSFFAGLKVNLDAEACLDLEQKVLFEFIDVDVRYLVIVRRGIAEVVRDPVEIGEPDIQLRLQSGPFKDMLARIANPALTLASFDYVKGNVIGMAGFMMLFEPPQQKLPFRPIE
jgi:linear primary-alkylsulfatase